MCQESVINKGTPHQRSEIPTPAITSSIRHRAAARLSSIFGLAIVLLLKTASPLVQVRSIVPDTVVGGLNVGGTLLTTGVASSITDIPGAVPGGIYGYGGKVYMFGASNTASGNLISGGLFNVASTVVGFIAQNLLYLENGSLMVMDKNLAVVSIDLTYSGGFYAFAINGAKSLINPAPAHNKNLNSQPIYFSSSSSLIMNTLTGSCTLLKYRLTGTPPGFSAIVNSNTYLTCSLTNNLNRVNDDFFSTSDKKLYLFTTINLGLIKTVPYTNNVDSSSGFTDSNDWTVFFVVIKTVTPINTQVQKLNITASDTDVQPSALNTYTLQYSMPSSNLQLNTLGMIALLVNSNPVGTNRSVIFLLKRDLTVYSMLNITIPGGDSFIDRTMVQFSDTIVNMTHYIGGFISGIPAYFQAYKLSLDKCDLLVLGVCRKCEAGYYRTTLDATSSCINKPMFMPGYGADELSNVVRPCDNFGCLSCYDNYTQCTECMPNFQIVDKQCQPYVPVELSLIESPFRINYSDFTFWLVPSVNFTYSNFDQIAQNISIRSEVYTSGISTPADSNATSLIKVIRDQVCLVQLHLQMGLKSKDSILSLNWPNDTDLIQDGITYKIKAFNKSIDLYEPYLTVSYIAEVEKYAKFSYAAGYVMGAEVTSQMLVFYLDAALVLDPTQIGLRLVQSYKVFSRLKYINLPFGPKLSKFTQDIGEILIGSQEFNQYLEATKPSGTRGKLSTLKLGLDFTGLYTARFLIYLSSFLLSFFCVLVVKRKLELQVWLMAIAFYAPRLHYVIFNLIAVDFMFYGARDLLHLTGTDFPNVMAFFSIFFMTLDFCLLAKSVMNDKNWKLEFFIQNRGFAQSGIEDVIIVTQPDDPDDLEADPDHEKQKIVKRAAVDSIDEAKIDYAKTFIELGRDAGPIWFLTRHIRLDEKVYRDKGCRFYSLIRIFKSSLYSSFIVASQYCTTLVLAFMIFFELITLSFIVIKFMKLKFISPFLLTVDLMQGMAILGISILMLTIGSMDKPSQTDDSIQVAICFIVILSMISEYFLSWVEIGYVFWNYLQSLKGRFASSYSWLRFLYRDLGYYDYIESSLANQPYKLNKTFFGHNQLVKKNKKKIVKAGNYMNNLKATHSPHSINSQTSLKNTET